MEPTAARKYAIIEKVMRLNEEELTELEMSLMKIAEEAISVEQYNQEIEEAEAEVKRGESYSQEEVEKMAGKW